MKAFFNTFSIVTLLAIILFVISPDSAQSTEAGYNYCPGNSYLAQAKAKIDDINYVKYEVNIAESEFKILPHGRTLLLDESGSPIGIKAFKKGNYVLIKACRFKDKKDREKGIARVIQKLPKKNN